MVKYYVVIVGRKTGIFTSWNECLEQVNKYPKATYKSFTNKEDADNYYKLNIGNSVNYNEIDYFIYTDGALINNVACYAWLITDKNKEVELLKHNGKVPLDKHTNITGELYAIYEVLYYINKNISTFINTKFLLYTDSLYAYNSILNKHDSKENIELIESIKKLLTSNIYFEHINSHCGNKWNDKVDSYTKL